MPLAEERADYTGSEGAIELKPVAPLEPGTVFEIRPPMIPAGSVPIFDDREAHAIVGYRHEPVEGWFKFYDLEGRVAGMAERGLEPPLVDPVEFIFVFAGLVRGLTRGALRATGTRMAAAAGVRITVRGMAAAAVAAMRLVLRKLVSVRSLRFTAATAKRMATKGRHVPLHILHLAIKYGARQGDPKRIKGLFQYTVPMFRNGQRYTLKVVVRESDWTIVHFHYQ